MTPVSRSIGLTQNRASAREFCVTVVMSRTLFQALLGNPAFVRSVDARREPGSGYWSVDREKMMQYLDRKRRGVPQPHQEAEKTAEAKA